MVRSNMEDKARLVFWAIFAFLICYYSSYVSPYYEVPMGCDSIIYHLMGRGMVEGLVPYRDLFDQKGPLIFLIYGFSYVLCGSYWLVFVLEVFAVMVSMVFVTRRRLYSYPGGKLLVSLCWLFIPCAISNVMGVGDILPNWCCLFSSQQSMPCAVCTGMPDTS